MPDRLAEALTFASGLSATYGELQAAKPVEGRAKVTASDDLGAAQLAGEQQPGAPRQAARDPFEGPDGRRMAAWNRWQICK